MSKQSLDREVCFSAPETEKVNGSPSPRETKVRVIPASEFSLHEEISPPEKPNAARVTVADIEECQSLQQPSLIVKVPVEYLEADRAVVFMVPIAPGDRQAQVMERLSQILPPRGKVELWSFPRQLPLCKDANCYDLVMRHGQHLQLRRRWGLFERLTQRVHDASCDCHPRQ